jgi:FKBP-type peptidyl-prolyl cis-trans isomerase (trigger factor)
MKKDIKKRLDEQAKMESDRINEELLLRKICDQTEVKVHPSIIERQFENMMENLSARLQKSGMNLETYAVYQGMTFDQFKEQQHDFAALGAKTGIILDAIGTKEGIKDFDAIIKFLKENNKVC